MNADEFRRSVSSVGLEKTMWVLAREHGMRAEDLLGGSRVKHVARARHEAMWLVRECLGWSYPAIGRLFNRDHTTIISAVRKVELEDTGKSSAA